MTIRVAASPLGLDKLKELTKVPDYKLPVNATLGNWIRGQFPKDYLGYCIDVGASDGMFVNSTWTLEKQHRWTVLSVEANPYMKPLLLKNRAFVKICAVGAESADGVDFHMNCDNLEAFSALNPIKDHPQFAHEAGGRWETVQVNVRTVEQLIAEAEFPRLDALCVDVEGGERDVLKGTDLSKWKPRVVVVEAWDQGSLDDYLCPRGYERVWTTASNDCYTRRYA